jgi:hypothetical protein
MKERSRMRKAIVFLVAALMLPSAALAKAPTNHTNHSHGKAAPRVMYVLKGTLSSYTAASPSADGSISITVNHSNYHGRALKGQTLTFAVSTKTRINYRHGTSSIADGAKGIVKFRAPRKVSGDMSAVLPTLAKALHVIVLKAAT